MLGMIACSSSMRSLYPWPIFPPDLEPPAARSLSLQLSLQEWVASFEIITNIQKKSTDGNLDAISNELQKFLLFSLDNPFAKKPGTLDKLCFYSDELTETSRSGSRESLDALLDYMRDEILSLRAKLIAWKKKAPPTFVISIEIKQLSATLTQRLREFYDALYPFFEEARSDENVLFYLIEKRETLNSLLNPKKIEHLLSRLYPNGPAHLRAILCEGYTRRGFSEFYAQHETLIDSIEWTADECLHTSAMHSS